MKKTAILLLFAGGALTAQPPETQITDNITAAFGGGVVNGSLVLTWPQFTYGGVTIAQSPSPGKTYAIVTGAVNLALVPTDRAPGYYYTAALTVSGHTISAIWSVPTLPSPQCSHSTYCTIAEVTVAAVTPAGVTINASQIAVGSSTNGQVICNVNGLVGWCTGGGANAVWGAITGTISNQTDLAAALAGKQAALGFTPANVASNLSDLASVSAARANLGLVIGTNVEAWSANLDLWSAKTPPTGTVVGTTDSQTLTNKTIDGVTPAVMGYLDATSSIQAQLNGKQATLGYTPANVASNLSDLANEAAARSNLGVAIGSNVEAWSANLDVWSGKTAPSGTVVGTTDAQTLGSKTLASPSLGSGQSPITQTWTVGTGGVTQYTLVDKDSSNPSKIVSGGALGIAMATVSAAGTVEVAEYGEVNCLTDTGGATAGDLAIVGTVTTNYCKDSGVTSSSAISIGSRVIGVFRSSAIAGAAATIELRPAHFGTQITGASLPAPTASTLGGIESIASLAKTWIAYIDTSGAPHQSQPAFADISGTAANAQIPAPTISALGGIEAASAATSNSFVTYVDTSGIQHVAQPAISGISGLGSGVAALLATFSTTNLATALSATPLYGGNNCGTANQIPYISSAGVATCDSGLTYAGSGGMVTLTKNALAATPTTVYKIANTTAATAGAPVQVPAQLEFDGTVWDTTATAASVNVTGYTSWLPVSGTNSTLDTIYQIKSNLNGAGVKNIAQFGSQLALCIGNASQPGMWLGNVTAANNNFFWCLDGSYSMIAGAGNGLVIGASANTPSVVITGTTGLQMLSTVGLQWYPSTSVLVTVDTTLSRAKAGWLEVNAGTGPGTSGVLEAAAFVSGGTAFTVSGCSPSGVTAAASAGYFTIGATSCTAVVTINGATGLTANNSFGCFGVDFTAGLFIPMASGTPSATTCSLAVPAGASSGDKIWVFVPGS